MNYAIFPVAALLLMPMPAMAFPVVMGSITNTLLFFMLFGVGATTYAAQRNRKIMAGLLITSLLICFYILSTIIATQALSKKNVGFPLPMNDSSLTRLHESALLSKTISFSQAKSLIQEHGYIPIQVADKKTFYIDGLNTFGVDDADRLESYAQAKGANGIVLFSNYLDPAVNLANELNVYKPATDMIEGLNPFSKNVFIAGARKEHSDGMSNLSWLVESFLDSSLNLQSVSSGALKKLDSLNEDGESETDHNRNDEQPVSSKVVFLYNESKHKKLTNHNVIVVGGEEILKTYVSMGSKVLNLPSMLFMDKGDWKSFVNTLDADKPTILLYTDNLSGKHKQKLSEYVYKSLSGHMTIDSLAFADASLIIGLAPPLPTDNYITPLHYNSDRHVSPTTLYATQRHYGEVSLLCFSKNCTNRVPSSNSSYNTQLINVQDVFSFKDYSLTTDLSSINLDKPIVIITEGADSSLLGYFMAHEVIKKGGNFLGFADLYNGLFGGTYINLAEKGTINEFYIDDFRVRIDTELQDFFLTFVPIEPIKTTSLWLIPLGLILGLGFTIRSLPLIIRVPSFVVAVYVSLYGSMMLQAPIEEYQHLFVSAWIYLALCVAVVFVGFNDNYPRNLQAITIFSMALIMAVFIALAFSPVMDRFYFGVLTASLVVGVSRKYLFANDAIPVLGEKYKLTEPFISGFKGYIVDESRQLSRFQLLMSRKWIIRSNHLTPFESGAGGFYESKLVLSKDVNSELQHMRVQAHQSDSIHCDQKGYEGRRIQFWVMPWRKYKLKGCAESHYNGYSLQVAYSVAADDNVTSGLDSDITFIKRTDPHSSLEEFLLSALQQCEMELGKPVSIEFGVNFLFGCLITSIDILQVRELPIHPCADKKSLAKWRSQSSNAVFVDQRNDKPLSYSAQSALYGYNVVATLDGTYRFKQANMCKFSDKVLLHAIDQIKAIRVECLRQSNIDLETLVDKLADALHGATNMMTNDTPVNEGQSNVVLKEVYQFSSDCGGLPSSLFLSDSPRVPFEKFGKLYEFTSRDLVHYVVLCALAVFDECRKQQVVGLSVSLSGLKEGYRNVQHAPKIPVKQDYVVVVAGEMASNHRDKNWLINYKEGLCNLKDITIVCDDFPSACIPLIPELGGIICKQGTPLSHVAITAKRFNIPMIIDRR